MRTLHKENAYRKTVGKMEDDHGNIIDHRHQLSIISPDKKSLALKDLKKKKTTRDSQQISEKSKLATLAKIQEMQRIVNE